MAKDQPCEKFLLKHFLAFFSDNNILDCSIFAFCADPRYDSRAQKLNPHQLRARALGVCRLHILDSPPMTV